MNWVIAVTVQYMVVQKLGGATYIQTIQLIYFFSILTHRAINELYKYENIIKISSLGTKLWPL